METSLKNHYICIYVESYSLSKERIGEHNVFKLENSLIQDEVVIKNDTIIGIQLYKLQWYNVTDFRFINCVPTSSISSVVILPLQPLKTSSVIVAFL